MAIPCFLGNNAQVYDFTLSLSGTNFIPRSGKKSEDSYSALQTDPGEAITKALPPPSLPSLHSQSTLSAQRSMVLGTQNLP